MSVESIITKKLDVWTSAIKTKTASGRGSSNKLELYGIKKLRELILELAVQGKLVAQNKNDKPAIQFLKDLEIAKVKLIEQGSLKKVKPLTLVDDVELPFSIPKSWHWERLGNLGNTQTGSTPPKANQEHYGSDIPFIKPADISDIGVDYDSMGLTFDGANKLGRIADEHSVLMVCIGTIGKCQLIDRKCSFNQQINSITPYVPEFGQYLYQALRSPYFSRLAWDKSSSTTIAILNKGKWESIPVPVPPLEEQKRIVVKVEELMALCDQLESQTESSIEAHQTLVKSLLETLTDAKDADELNESWQRISEHFDVLFTTEDSIDQLKQTILQLAVMGKLVKQDPNDQPASLLFDELSKEQERWLKEEAKHNSEAKTMLRKLNKLGEPLAPFPLPKGWVSVHLIQLCEMLVDCHNKTAPYSETGTPIIRTSNIRERQFVEKDLKYVDRDTYEYWSRRCPPLSGDIIFTREAPMGEALIIPENCKWCLGQRTMLIRPLHKFVLNEYLLLALTEPHLLERASDKAVGLTVKHLRVGDVENLNLPLPPLTEQKRIVAKAQLLMDLCADLKSQLSVATTIQLKVADSISD